MVGSEENCVKRVQRWLHRDGRGNYEGSRAEFGTQSRGEENSHENSLRERV